ncbi:MAG: DUF2236 domain-containing protein [Ramlibacter sp.]|nr:DUF2236 domain-containing protein [Ramlibacter sp.]
MTPPSEASLHAMTRVADPLADRTIGAIVGPWSDAPGAMDAGLQRLATATRLMAQWRTNAGLADWQPEDPATDPTVVTALRSYLEAGRRLPEWTDPARVARAEEVFMREGPMACTLLFCASLPECYVPPQLARVLHIAGQLEAHTEHRIRQTAAMVFPVMLEGGLTDGTGCGVAQVLKVRLIHATIRHLILHGEPDSRLGPVPRTDRPSNATGGHAALQDALLAHGWNPAESGLPCNQLELAYTLLTFHYVFLRGMRTMGLGLAGADEEAFLHAWNVVGHVLGVQEPLMADRYDEAAVLFTKMREVGCAQPATPDARPGLGRALVGTMAHSIRLPVIRGIPVPMTQWLIGPEASRDIGIGAAASWPTRFAFLVGRTVTATVDAVVRRVQPQFSISRMFTRVIGYHLLSRFLLDQTRALNLPEQVLNPLHEAVADWHHEPRSPRWLNRLEDALTTTGRWLAHPHAAHSRPSTGKAWSEH